LDVIDMNQENTAALDRIERLMDSLETVTARILETAVVSGQLASSQTPEMRRLFDTWIACVSEEISRRVLGGGSLCIGEISGEMGLAPSSVVAILSALDRQGAISITHVTAVKCDGENREICGCVRQAR
jgi:hypothetical protein